MAVAPTKRALRGGRPPDRIKVMGKEDVDMTVVVLITRGRGSRGLSSGRKQGMPILMANKCLGKDIVMTIAADGSLKRAATPVTMRGVHPLL